MTCEKIRRVIRRYVQSEHQLVGQVGFFVGLHESNPFASYKFEDNHVEIQLYGSPPMIIKYPDLVSVDLPNSVRELPFVVAWAEGYFMVHKAVLHTSLGEVDVFGGVLHGKSDVYVWHNIVTCIRATMAKDH